ncbi:MAG: SGNH/GDSL hydrolase family protein [Tepidisphaeraceae bacterium]
MLPHPVDILRFIWLLAFVVFLSVGVNLALLFRFVFTGLSKTRSVLMKLCLLGYTLLLLFFILELTFAHIVIPDGFDQTLASKIWFRDHWNPINALGYRDTDNKDVTKRLALVVGDSFVAGHGVEKIEDRFGEQLGRELGKDWEVAIVAQNGWNTKTELEKTRDYPALPELIVLSYFPNDIWDAAAAAGHRAPKFVGTPGRFTNWMIMRSFFLNWVYWRLQRGTMGNEFWQYLVDCYNNPKVWESHSRELQQFVDFAKEKNIKLAVVVWPNLNAVAQSKAITARVAECFRSHGVPVLDLSLLLESRDRFDMVVNSVDAHPNLQVHREVAHQIYLLLEKEGYLSGPR